MNINLSKVLGCQSRLPHSVKDLYRGFKAISRHWLRIPQESVYFAVILKVGVSYIIICSGLLKVIKKAFS